MIPSKQSGETPNGINPFVVKVFNRLEALSLEEDFRLQREQALRYFLQPYLNSQLEPPLDPLAEEVDLTKLYLYADYVPSDGQQPIIEQLRDNPSGDLPEEETSWLEPIRQSYMDVLEVMAKGSAENPLSLHLRSLGDGSEYWVSAESFGPEPKIGQILFTRLLRQPECTCFSGTAVRLSPRWGKALFQLIKDFQGEYEAVSGNFELSEWPKFAKHYPYLMMWALADLRVKAFLEEENQFQYVTSAGYPFLYAVALYDHHDIVLFAETLNSMENLSLGSINLDDQGQEPTSRTAPGRDEKTRTTQTWVELQEPSDGFSNPTVVTRLTLTNSQLWVECDSAERLDTLKHQLAAQLGFSLHFRGETTTKPSHDLKEIDLEEDEIPINSIEISQEEEYRLLSEFLETVFLDWAEKPSPALKGQTPRHYASTPEARKQVADLINELEQQDLALRHVGKSGYDYNILRAHVGL